MHYAKLPNREILLALKINIQTLASFLGQKWLLLKRRKYTATLVILPVSGFLLLQNFSFCNFSYLWSGKQFVLLKCKRIDASNLNNFRKMSYNEKLKVNKERKKKSYTKVAEIYWKNESFYHSHKFSYSILCDVA